jgi:hypothetical protein
MYAEMDSALAVRIEDLRQRTGFDFDESLFLYILLCRVAGEENLLIKVRGGGPRSAARVAEHVHWVRLHVLTFLFETEQ